MNDSSPQSPQPTPTGLPFRRIEGEPSRDAVAYCPVCRSSEVRLTRTYVSHLDMIGYTDGDGFRVANIPMATAAEQARTYHGLPWQVTIFMECGSGHEFELLIFADNGLTWAEIQHDSKGLRGAMAEALAQQRNTHPAKQSPADEESPT